jgi:WD40 repeat protein
LAQIIAIGISSKGYWVRGDVVRPTGDDSCFALTSRLLTPESIAAVPTLQANPFEATNAVTMASTATLLPSTQDPDRIVGVFDARDNTDSEIFGVLADGLTSVKLTENEIDDRQPVLSPNGNRLAVVVPNADNSEYLLRIYDRENGTYRDLVPDIENYPAPMSWSPDSESLVYIDAEGSVNRIDYDGDNYSRLVTLGNNGFATYHATNVAWSPDGLSIAYVVGLGDDFWLYVYDIATENTLELPFPTDETVTSLMFTPDGSSLFYITRDYYMALFLIDIQTGERLLKLDLENMRYPTVLAWLSETTLLIEDNDEGNHFEVDLVAETVRQLNTASLIPSRTITPRTLTPSPSPFPTTVPPTSTPLPPSLSVSQLPTTAITNGNASQLSLIGTVPLPITVEIIGMSADRSVVAMAGSGRLYVYDLINLRLIELPNSQYQRGVNDNLSIAISPDGRYLAYPGDFRTYEVIVYGVVEGRVVATLRGHTDAINALAFSPTALTLATAASDETIRLWEVGTWRATQTLERNDPLQVRVDNIFSLAFSPDGRGLLASTYANVDIWDIATGRVAGSIASSGRQAVSNSATQPIMIVPNAAALVGMTGGTQIDVWNLQTLEVTATFSVSAQSFDVNEGANLLVTDTLTGFNVYSFFTTETLFAGESGYSFPSRMYFSRSDTLLVVVKSNEIQLWGIP